MNHWRYSASYTERLAHWPHWLNEATADFEVKKLHGHALGQYSVESTHRTCFLFGLYCCKYMHYLEKISISQIYIHGFIIFVCFSVSFIFQCIQRGNFSLKPMEPTLNAWKLFVTIVRHSLG